MNKYRVILTPEVIDDLRDIYSYIAITLQAKNAAAKQLNQIRQAIYKLDTLPFRYKLIEWEPWASMNVRSFSVGNYQIFYIVSKETKLVSILHVFYSGRDIQSIIKKEQ